MSRHLLNQELGILPLFQPGLIGVDLGLQPDRTSYRVLWPKPQKLLEYKPHASDKQVPHDIQVRVSGNMGSKKEPVEVAGPRWVENHPAVYAEFKHVALELIAQGRKHYGAKGIAEYLRLHTSVEGGSEFKIANFAVTYLAVKFVQEHPEHSEFFKIVKKGGGR